MFSSCPPIIIEYKHFNCARQKKASINIFEEFVLMPLMESTSLSWFGPHLLSWQVLAVMTTWTFNEEKCWTLFERASGWSFPTVAHGQASPTTCTHSTTTTPDPAAMTRDTYYLVQVPKYCIPCQTK